MKPSIKQKVTKSFVGIIIAILLFFSSGLKIPVVDTTPDAFFQESITKAGIAYATCRVINASVSIVKDSSLQLEPAGIGVSLAVGQALDPIDDMTERLSDVLVTANSLFHVHMPPILRHSPASENDTAARKPENV